MSAVRLLLVLAAFALAAAAPAAAAPPKLVGTVGPGFTISLTLKGKAVRTLKAGTYRLVVRDKAAIHSFAMDGPRGFAKDFTSVPFTGTKTFTLKLTRGSWTFYCPPHEPQMFGRFRVR